MKQDLIINHQSGKPFLMGAEIDLLLEPRLSVSKLISKLETGNWYLRHWIHEKNKLRASMTSVVTSIHNFKQESLFRIKACRGVAFCEAGSSLAPLHLSRTLYKSPLFMQNKPNFPDTQMNVNIYITTEYQNFIPLAGYKNKPNSNPIKPNFRKAKMNVNSFITKDYRKKDDFSVRINKPNFRNGRNERKLNFNKGLQKKRLFSSPKNKPNSNPIKACPVLAEALSAAEGAVEWANFFKGQNRLPENPATPLFSHDSIIACLKWGFRLYYQDWICKRGIKMSERAEIELFDNPCPERDYCITIKCPEFTSLCPRTSQPDFGEIVIDYCPDKLCIELKSLKFYLHSYRNKGIFYEALTNDILDDLKGVCKPRWMKITSRFTPRGGITTEVVAEYKSQK